MSAPRVRTDTPGVYRRGPVYSVTWRTLDGRQHWQSVPTIKAARKLKSHWRREAKEQHRATLLIHTFEECGWDASVAATKLGVEREAFLDELLWARGVMEEA